MNTVLIIAIVLLGLLALGNILTYTLQFYILFRPQSLDPNFSFKFAYSFEEVNLTTTDEGKINAIWFKKNGKKSEKGVVIYFHGNVGNLSKWGHVYGSQFHETGYDLFIMDYRRYGKSTGKVSEKHFFEDAQEVYRFVNEHYASEQIIIYGRSIGSGCASYLASKVKAKRLILETPFSSVPELFHTYYPFLPKLFLFRFPFKNKEHLKKVDYSITIFAAGADMVTPLRSSTPLKTSLKETDEFIIIEGAGHSNLWMFDEFREKLAKRLE